VRGLLDRGADVALKDGRGWTALMIAADRGHKEIVALLLSAGADPMVSGSKGETAAELASDPAIRSLLAVP
jgi:ankyrin repeat protein